MVLIWEAARRSVMEDVIILQGLTTALLDRLGHHSHIITTRGSSFRSRTREKDTTPSPTRRKEAERCHHNHLIDY
ncbi:MAG: hypothetical protein HYX84_04050 [Chloroflexi bacterium]|nr:hypothetical protein [Chloroflexota bacterium]